VRRDAFILSRGIKRVDLIKGNATTCKGLERERNTTSVDETTLREKKLHLFDRDGSLFEEVCHDLIDGSTKLSSFCYLSGCCDHLFSVQKEGIIEC